jgi:phosphoglycolate phosphatase-like HAD superfamily hydrolase
MAAIIFDLDGTLVDSVIESNTVAFMAYNFMKDHEGQIAINKEAHDKANKMRPFMKSAEEYYAASMLVASNKVLDEKEFNAFLGATSTNETEEFVDIFYQERKKLIKSGEFLEKIKPFEFAVHALNFLSRNHEIFISTSRDFDSTKLISEKFMPKVLEENMFSREFSLDKKSHINQIKTNSGEKTENIVFVDDILDQTVNAMKTGVKVGMASWGYCTEQQKGIALKNGVTLLQEKKDGKRLEDQIEEML